MKLSLENEIRLKNILRQDDKQSESKKLANEIEKKEIEMTKHITEDYINIIDRCNDLQNLKNKIPIILNKNESLISEFKEKSLEISRLEGEIDEHEMLDCRIQDLLEELEKIEIFFEIINQPLDEEDELYFYKMTQNMKKLENSIKMFSQYLFYDNIYDIFISYKNKFDQKRLNLFRKYQLVLMNESVEIGKNVIKIIDNGKQKIIFNELEKFRKFYLPTSLLELFYMNDKLDTLENFIDFFNIERKIFLISYNKNDKIFFYISEILNSYFLVQHNANILDFYNLIVEKINNICTSEQILKFKDILVKLKNLIQLLNIKEENINELIGRISIEYFSNNNLQVNINERSDFKQSLNNFIEEGFDFTKQFENEEINELFVNKINIYLKNFLDTSNVKTVFEDEKYVNSVIKNVNNKFPEIYQKSQPNLSNIIVKLKNNIAENNKNELESIFKSKDFNINLQKFMTKNSKIISELYPIIKEKFLQMIDNNSNKNIETKRDVCCKVSCFYMYLEKIDSNLCNDFINVNKKADKLLENNIK